MTTVRDVIARDLSRRIEEIIKVDQLDDHAVFTELSEYVPTDRIRTSYRTLFRAIAEAPSDPHEGTGIWVSGFFGSGKSSFAKNLGYVLANRQVLGKRAGDLLKERLQDPRISELVDLINLKIPTEIVMFDVQTDRAAGGTGSTSIAPLMYRALLRTLDYAEDFDIAELEQTLEADARLEEFQKRFEKHYGKPWRVRRKMAHKMNEASAILHEMDPKTFPQADSWSHAQLGRRVEVTPKLLVERTFELIRRRRPNHTVAFIVDEVGAYVARSVEKIEELRAVVEQFGKESRNRVRARQSPAPVWVVVTSQEKLDEVVAAIDSKRVELSKLQDRFRKEYHVDLAPADIRVVATERVLAKKKEGVDLLRDWYRKYEGQINQHLRLERTTRPCEVTEDEFVRFYPYPPHFLDLSIDIMSGIRLQPGAARHLGGSNRTIISQAYSLLVSERTRLADADLGRLVTMDQIFDLVEGNLASERQKDVSDIAARFGHDSWPVRVAKAIALLEFVRDLPRTEINLAAVLHDRVDSAPAVPQVKKALQQLQDAQFIRNTEEGYKLQTAIEKSWDAQRRDLDPSPRERGDALRELLDEVFSDPKLRRYAYEDLRTFKVGLWIDEVRASDGEVVLYVLSADDQNAMATVADRAQLLSRQKEHAQHVAWAFALTPEIEQLLTELCRSRSMSTKYDQLRAQGKINPDEMGCLAAEKQDAIRLQGRLRELLTNAWLAGRGFFQGIPKDGSTLGRTLAEVVRGLLDYCIPQLYPKLALGSRRLSGTEAEEILKAANLTSLPQVFYDGDDGLGLVVQEGGKQVLAVGAPVAKEVLDFIQAQNSYGEKVTGKELEERFQKPPYGWERDLLRLVLAVLLRAGAIEVTHQGKCLRNYQDPLARPPLTNVHAFRSASFAPREVIELRTLTTAAEHLETLTGEEVDIEEGALAEAFKKLAEEEQAVVVPMLATARAHRLPVEPMLAEYSTTLRGIRESASDDCVRLLSREGASFRDLRSQARELRNVLKEDAIEAVRHARIALESMWPVLKTRGGGDLPVQDLERLLSDPSFYQRLPDLRSTANAVGRAYGELYERLHKERRSAVTAAVDGIKGTDAWTTLTPATPPRGETGGVAVEEREQVGVLLEPLTSRGCDALKRPDGELVCSGCRATIGQMESDLAAIPSLRAQIQRRVHEKATPEARLERVRVADLSSDPLRDEPDVKRFLKGLEEVLLKYIAQGAQVVVE